MPKISLDSNSIQIELTQAEAASYGFALNRPQLFRKKRSPSGGLLLELFSIDLTKTVETSEVSAWIPVAQTFPGSCGCQEQSTAKQGTVLPFNASAAPTEDFMPHYLGISGHHPHPVSDRVEGIGVVPSTFSAPEPSDSSSKAAASQAVTQPLSQPPPA